VSFDLEALRDAVARHGRVARIVVAETRGSVPREVGAAMLVWADGDGFAQSGTIGGGALEYQAAEAALSHEGLRHVPLGPGLGQCCGGAVTLLTEVFTVHNLPDAEAVYARAVSSGDVEPLAVARLLDRARAQGAAPEPQLLQGWMIEPVLHARRPLWIWGAGHVGRALVETLAPLADVAITWIDTGVERYPETVPDGVTALPARHPERLMRHAPKEAAHIILTFSHALDLDLCHAALAHGFGFCGLIGSDTKWARFRSRLKTLGHTDAQISTICCPIGQKALGKHPQAIAIGVAAQILSLEPRENQTWTTSSSASTA
jgi:xanthine dehydrogenase accessory factor